MADTGTPAPGSSNLKRSIGRYGIWSIALRLVDQAERPQLSDALAELEDLGYRMVWPGGSPSIKHARTILEESTQLTAATSVQTIREQQPEDAAKEFAALEDAHPGRFYLGLGVAQASSATAMTDYLDALDAAGLPAERRLLASLGPKMLRLARDRSAGSIPYLTTPEHTARAREILGDGPLLAPEAAVLLETDPDRARTIARLNIGPYMAVPGYANNLLRSGFTEEDLADGGSDRLIDTLVAWGDEERVKKHLDDYFAAGADHVAIQLIHENPTGFRYAVKAQPLEPALLEGWRRLGNALLH